VLMTNSSCASKSSIARSLSCVTGEEAAGFCRVLETARRICNIRAGPFPVVVRSLIISFKKNNNFKNRADSDSGGYFRRQAIDPDA
jgi:hypothetical protein